MDAKKGADNRVETRTLGIADSKQQNAEASQSQDKSRLLDGLPMYFLSKDKGVIQPLNAPARNAIAHRNPNLVKHAIAEALQSQANKEGLYKDMDCVARWKPSAIPFHIEFEISVPGNTCQHLASFRKITAKDPEQYVKNLIPLAKLFLRKPQGSHLPHLPFTRPLISCDNLSPRTAEEKQTAETIQHVRFIFAQHKSLAEIDIKTAEATARMVNAGKILSGLLVYLTSPKPPVERATMPTDPKKKVNRGPNFTGKQLSAVQKKENQSVPTKELEDPRPVLKDKQDLPHPENSIDELVDTAKPVPGENSATENVSPKRRTLSSGSAATKRSSKEDKASKKKNHGKKRLLKERAKNKAISPIIAYPTQRPPRKKSARKSLITKESLHEERLEPEGRDREQVPAAQPPTVEAFTHNNHEEITPEQPGILDESLEGNLSPPEAWSEEMEGPKTHTPAGIHDPEQPTLEFKLLPSLVLYDEDLFTTFDTAAGLSLLAQPTQEHGSGAQGVLWTYATNTIIDDTLEDAGLYLWLKPKTYFRAQRLLRSERFGYTELAPVIVSHERTEDDEPLVEFDGETVHIVPHERCWEDIRSSESHPDFLVPWKLVEYQACEAAGYQIWRHDRDLLKCRMSGCGANVSDYNDSAIVCLGCGPKSVIRYCSLQHQLEDVERHWKECGERNVILRRIIDHSTAPRKFDRMYPAIKPRHGSKTAVLHRQMLYSALTYGHYTLFYPSSGYSQTLCWPKQDPNWPEMDRRIERLLNIAFLDGWNHCILGYLFRLLRELLRSQGEWCDLTERLLARQFEAEFSDYKVNTHWRDGEAPCQCEWTGRSVPRWDHLSTCWEYDPVADDYASAKRQRYIKATVEDYEERFWILRAWRQQHPTVNNWRLRAAGHGFPSIVPNEECYELGPRWTGWGGEEDNIRQDQWKQRGKRSLRSA